MSEPNELPAKGRGPMPYRMQKVRDMMRHVIQEHPSFQCTSLLVPPPKNEPDAPVQGLVLTEEDTVQFWRTHYGEDDTLMRQAAQEYDLKEKQFNDKYPDPPSPFWPKEKVQEYAREQMALMNSNLEFLTAIKHLVDQRKTHFADDPKRFSKNMETYVNKHKDADQTSGLPMIPFWVQ